jgi:endonuclease/exonuclease/phosphatase family metal-dependent hydrolase
VRRAPVHHRLLLAGLGLLIGCAGPARKGEGAAEPAAEPLATLQLASFNIRDFGPAKLEKEDVMTELAQIVDGYPFVAVQELSDVEQDVPYAFLERLNADQPRYQMLLSPRTGQQPDDRDFEEQYAFYYDESVLEPLHEALFDDSSGDFFVREPYAALFATRGGFTFVALTIHTTPSNAVAELARLPEVMAWAASEFAGEDDFVLLGDLNADCSSATLEQLAELELRRDEYAWIVPDDADTTVSSTDCAYDRIVITSATAGNFTGGWGVDSSFSDDSISDHWPVWAEFWNDER